MSEFLKYVNITFEIWGILFCTVAVIVQFTGTKIEKKTRNHFRDVLNGELVGGI